MQLSYAERGQKAPGRIQCHPLLSQPVVELGLQIPTYQSFDQGFDRIYFRKAVSHIQKPKALWRHIKGQTSNSMINALSANADTIQSMLLNGSLAKAGLIDQKWLIDALAQIKHGKMESTWPIVNLLSAQQWLDQWGL